MKELRFDSKEAWMVGRLGKTTGSTAKDTVNVRDGETKAGVWRAAAESIIGTAAIAEADLTSTQIMERGHELEADAIKRFEAATGKKVKHDLVIWEHDEDPRISVSPDGVIGKTEAVEVKCLLSPKHTEALYRQSIPKNTGGYEEQRLQYFIVNEKLRKLYHVFYHPDFPAPLDFFYIVSTRQELQPEIDRFFEAERQAVAKVREIVNMLTLYSPEDIQKINAVKEELLGSAVESHSKDMKKVRAMINPKAKAV